MRTARADVEQLLDWYAALVDIEGYIESRRDVSEDDRDALWLYAWSRSKDMLVASAVGRSPPGPDELGERLRNRDSGALFV